MKRKPTVTIGVAAFNEEANIGAMLTSVLTQREERVRIKEIYIVSDGSTDKTVKVARSFQSRKIRIVPHKVRQGQSARIREILKRFSGDILVLMDADTVLANEFAIQRLVAPFRTKKHVGVVAGNTLPIPGKTFLERGINNYIYARQSLQSEYNFGKKAFVAHAYLAYSRAFTNAFIFPEGLLNHDAYSYFAAKARGYAFAYVHNSVSFYRSASRMREYINQTTRHLAGGRQLYLYFGEEAVHEGFRIPHAIMRKIMLYQVKKNIFGYILLKVLYSYCSSYCSFRSKKWAKGFNTRWDHVTSTKGMISL